MGVAPDIANLVSIYDIDIAEVRSSTCRHVVVVIKQTLSSESVPGGGSVVIAGPGTAL